MTAPARHRALPFRCALAALLLAVTAAAIPPSTRAQAQEGATIVAHGISTFGALKYDADFPHLEYVNPDAPKGGEVSIWAFGNFDSMNPYTRQGRSGALSSIFFESLLVATADEPGASYGLLAESIEYPEDRTWAIFTLREEARFSDGTPVTPEDVVFSYETLRDKGLPSFRLRIRSEVASAEVLDARRVRFDFQPDASKRDLIQTVGGLPIFQRAHYVDNEIDFEASTLRPAIGSGPYVLDRIDVGKTIVYRRNPDYWGADLPINRGRWNFDRIRVEYYGDYNAAFEGFKAGSYTFRNEAASLIWATGYDFPAITRGWARKEVLPDGNMATGQSFIFNLRRPQFEDVRVREAIGLMFNFEWSNATLFYGLYARIHSFWENSDLAAEGLPTEGELRHLRPLADMLPESIFTEPAVMAPESGDRQLDRRNLRRASALLDEAGWTVGSDGLRRNGHGTVLRVEILNDSQTFERVINPFVENLRRLGVDAVLTRIDNAQMTQRERSFDFDMIVEQFPMSLTPGGGLYQYFGSESAADSVFNKAGFSSPVVDKLIDAVTRAESRDELRDAVRALDRVLRAYRFWVPQWFKDTHTVAFYDMYEHPDPLPPYDLGLLDLWWMNMDRFQELRAAGAF